MNKDERRHNFEINRSISLTNSIISILFHNSNKINKEMLYKVFDQLGLDMNALTEELNILKQMSIIKAANGSVNLTIEDPDHIFSKYISYDKALDDIIYHLYDLVSFVKKRKLFDLPEVIKNWIANHGILNINEEMFFDLPPSFIDYITNSKYGKWILVIGVTEYYLKWELLSTGDVVHGILIGSNDENISTLEFLKDSKLVSLKPIEFFPGDNYIASLTDKGKLVYEFLANYLCETRLKSVTSLIESFPLGIRYYVLKLLSKKHSIKLFFEGSCLFIKDNYEYWFLRNSNIDAFRRRILRILLEQNMALDVDLIDLIELLGWRDCKFGSKLILPLPNVINKMIESLGELDKYEMFLQRYRDLLGTLEKILISKRIRNDQIEVINKYFEWVTAFSGPPIQELIEDKVLRKEDNDLILIDEEKFFKRVIDEIISFIVNRLVKLEKEEPKLQKTNEIKILLGYGEKNKKIYWDIMAVPNPHFAIIGMSGSGKSQTIKAIILELSKYNLPVFAIDFANEYSDVIKNIIDPLKGFSINPLEILEGRAIETAYKVSGVIKSVLKLGDQQEAILRNTILDLYNVHGIDIHKKYDWNVDVPSFNDIRVLINEYVEARKYDRRVLYSLLNRLGPIFDLKIFGNENNINMSGVIRKGGTLFLRDLPNEEIKIIVAELYVRHLWHHIQTMGETHIPRIFIVLDEAHKLAYPNSPVDDILRQGRKYGVGVMISTQQPDDFIDKHSVFNNIATILSFALKSKKHATFMIDNVFGIKDKRWIRKLQNLKKFNGLLKVHGMNKPCMVRIIPYYKRIEG